VGIVAEKIDSQMDAFGITVSPFNRLAVRLAVSFYRHRSGLSLADRVCLAIARSVASPAYTAVYGELGCRARGASRRHPPGNTIGRIVTA
jgi:PIN domain nuclease of toxin-antitoxin system